jgi:AAA domain
MGPVDRASGPDEPGRAERPAGHTGPIADAARVVRFWHAVEIFSPQELPKVDAKRIADLLPGEPMPWEPGSRLDQEPIKPDQVWRHEVFGGVYQRSRVRDALVKRFGDDAPDGDQQAPARGQSALFACTFDAEGRLVEESAVLSACAWAIGRMSAAGRAANAATSGTWLAGFDQEALRYGCELGKLAGSKVDVGASLLAASMRAAVPTVTAGALQTAAEQGPVDGGAASPSLPAPTRPGLGPVTGADLQRFTAELAARLRVTRELSPRGVRVRSYKIPASRADDPVQHSFLNSFIADDLERVARALLEDGAGAGLAAYLTSARRLSCADRVDVRSAPLAAWAGCMPGRFPLGRWVADTDHALAFSQQFAVNQIMDRLSHGSGLFAVNGPPGTGKTTMLRDLIAANIVERALRLAQLTTPGEAFTGTKVHTWQAEKMRHTIVTPRRSLTGFEMVVASANNAAVENITAEIPGPKGIGTQWRDQAEDLDYFISTAKLTCGDGAWGLVAARLGNMANRRAFSQGFWWGAGNGADDTGHGMKEILKGLEATPVNWEAAVAQFRGAAQRVRDLAAGRQAVADAIRRLWATGPERESWVSALAAAEEACQGLIASQRALDERLQAAEAQLNEARERLGEHRRDKPGLIVSISTWFRAGREWHDEHRGLLERYRASAEQLNEMRRDARNLRSRLRAARHQSQRARSEIARLDAEAASARQQIGSARTRWGAHIPDGPEYAETRCGEAIEQRELSAPWADAEFTSARTELFIAALRLHKTFITSQAAVFRKNLNALADILDGGKGRPPATAVLATWQTFFLVVPVVSSAFASIDRLFAGLSRESLGWTLIDEAGQAAPQQAIGAIWRARRTVVVGDPLQLEPVVTLPWGGQQALLREFGVDEEWAPSRTSVQCLADRLSRHGTSLPSVMPDGSGQVWVSTPLRVHRRCDRPIFDLSNQIAYDGLMVYGTRHRDPFHGYDVWYDVKSAAASGHWVPAEGKALREILERLAHADVPVGQIRVLSPFRQVVAGARNEYSKVFPEVTGKERDGSVGTVHIMQGKEADVVILILGTHPDQSRSRSWAAGTPNLLNVAVSRARRRLYVIGNRQTWGSLSYFAVLAAHLPVWPPRDSPHLNAAEVPGP